MEKILQNVQDWFLSNKEYLEVFAQRDSRLEGWFKGELLLLLNRLKHDGIIEDFKQEVKCPNRSGRRSMVDLEISVSDGKYLCELKALSISQTDSKRNLNYYFKEDNAGIINDFKKLNTIPNKNKYVIAFIYPNPGNELSIDKVLSLPRNLRHWQRITDQSNFPDFLFISVWRSLK